MEVRGLTPIDSLYEYAGFRLATSLSDLATSVGLPLIFALAGLAYLLHTSLQRDSMRDVLIHVFYLMFMAWMLGSTQVTVVGTGGDLRERMDLKPAETTGIPVPRYIAYLNGGADHLQRKAVESINQDFLDGPFERERLAAAMEAADIFDGVLKDDLWQFSQHCFKLAVARDERASSELRKLDPLVEGNFDYGQGVTTISDADRPHQRVAMACWQARDELLRRVSEHLKAPFHEDVIHALVTLFTEGKIELEKPPDLHYRATVVMRAMLGANPRRSNAHVVIVGSLPKEAPKSERNVTPVSEINDLYDGFVGLYSSWKQNAENDVSTKQRMYLAINQGPYVYGLALMIVLGLFPVVGLVSLLPGRWRALLNYAKVFVSIKLWPVCWAALSRFSERSKNIDVFGDHVNTADFVIVVSSMYALTPLLCFAMVSLATSVTALPFQQGFSTPAGGNAMGAVVNVAGAAVAKRLP